MSSQNLPNQQRSAVYRVTLLLSCLLLSACASLPWGGEVVKSPHDVRDYRALQLPNGMKVLLISDPTTDKAAAAVDVGIGSNADPARFAGLSHFLEHMLFLGTDKYPQPGEYQGYIASRGGSHNAYTAYENTNYYFNIDQQYLGGALDRFAQFFIAPRFSADYVERERNAVHSEYQAGLQDDGRRSYSVLKQVLNPAHPLSGFSTGSLDTLRDHGEDSLRDALLTHYERYYSANLMTLAILGRESLDELEALARTHFSAVENRHSERPRHDAPVFVPGTLPSLLAIEPVRDARSLSYTFPVPNLRDEYKAKPLNYIGNMLGHEGEGSLLERLRELGWANALSAGGGFAYRDASAFTVSIALTEAGVAHVDEISALLFQFIALTRQQGLQQWIFDELRQMADLAFQFQEPARPVSYVSGMARQLQEYPATELITAGYAYERFDPALLDEVLGYLRPDNVLLTLTSRTVEGDRVDPWYGTEYALQPLTDDRLAAWQRYPDDPALALAPPNPFLPEDITLKPYLGQLPAIDVPSVTLKPELLVDRDGVRLWFKQDSEFLVPRANFNVYALTPLFGDTLHHSLLATLLVRLVNDQLSAYAYPANLAGASFGLSQRSRGFSLTVSGYSDKQQRLLEALLQTLVAADFAEERFAIIKAELVRRWQNAALQTPYTRLFQEAQALLIDPYWSEQERIAAIESLTLSDVKAFVPQVLENLRLDALYHGNVLPGDALRMLDTVTRYLQPSAAAPLPPYASVVRLPPRTRLVQELEIAHDDSAIVLYFQGEGDSLETRATINLLATILSGPFFETLRTEQQLGYIVNATTLPILKTNGLVLYIESPVADPLLLEQRIDAFLADFGATLAAMPPAQFADFQNGLVTSLRQPPQRLSELTGRYWRDILIEEYAQDSTLQMADAIAALTQADVLGWYRTRLADPDAGRLVARSAGRPHRDDYLMARREGRGELLFDNGNTDYRRFKQTAEVFEF